ncbi:MAG: hypothetical protein PQJ46_07945 [Spirochaetales bacterium]|nr:hypothetical protein [Spirochaetales bacterium]
MKIPLFKSKDIVLFILLTTIIFSGCSMFILNLDETSNDSTTTASSNENSETTTSLTDSMLIIIEHSLYSSIKSSVDTYIEDLSSEDIDCIIATWTSTDVVELKDLLKSYSGVIESAFLIGDLPAAWYEQTAFNKEETFPTDLYFMDTDSVWSDSDENGYFDYHSDLHIDIYTSRLTGTADEVNFYFNKLHNYRTNSGETPVYDNAFIFKDDDWQDNYKNNYFGLDSIYSSVDYYQTTLNTTRASYENKLTQTGVEYVFQWIHAYPTALFVDEGDNYNLIKTEDIATSSFNANFYNLFDCKAARFTVDNVAESYINQTESCIAIMGSTKAGGVYYPVEFHKAIAAGYSWGEAYKKWYNNIGCEDDSWYLGIVIMGDPTIHPYHATGTNLSKSSRSISDIIPLSKSEKEKLYNKFIDFETSEVLPEEIRATLEKNNITY